ncbi:MAG: TIGR02444 family protein [Alphaproteobacteria bacterium]
MARVSKSAEAASFWDFSLDCYGRAGVAAACLDLQDRRGLDVNVLLFCCYAAAAHGFAMSVKEILAAESRVAMWQSQIIQPLRAARRAMPAALDGVSGSMIESIKARITDAERAAEEAEQACLAAVLAQRGDHAPTIDGVVRGLAGHNLRAYLSGRGHALGPADEDSLNAILDGCFPLG